MLFKKCEISAVPNHNTGMNRREEIFFFFFTLFCLFVKLLVWGRLRFHFRPLTHSIVTELVTAAGRWAAPLEQSPAVKVPCSRALWQWLLKEDWTFPDLFTFSHFVQGIKPVTFRSWTVTTLLLLPSILLWPTSLLCQLCVLLFNSCYCFLRLYGFVIVISEPWSLHLQIFL